MTFQPSAFLHQHPLPPDDKLLPGGNAIVDRNALADILARWLPEEMPSGSADQIVFEGVRYKPGIKLSVVVTLSGLNGTPLRFLLQAYTEAAASTVWNKLQAKGMPTGAGMFLEEIQVVVLRWPWDPQLPGLAPYLSSSEAPRLVRRLLPQFAEADNRMRTYSYQAKVLRYRPERHVVLRLEFQVRKGNREKQRENLIARVFSPGALPSTFHGELDGLVPKTLARDPRHGLIIEEFLTGVPLEQVLKESPPGAPRGLALAQEAGRTLALFHARANMVPRDQSFADDLESARGDADILRLLSSQDADLAEAWREQNEKLRRSLEAQKRAKRMLVHGDLHPGQFLCGDRSVRLIDLEKMHLGTVAMDLGSLLFFLRAGSLRGGNDLGPVEGIFGGYAQVASEMPSMEEVLIFEQLTALRRIASPLRNLHPCWREWAEQYLNGAVRSGTW